MNKIEKIMQAAMAILAEEGWAAVTLPALARRTRLSLKAVEAEVTAPADILIALIEWVDAKTLVDRPDGDTVRERLFELAMNRFDVLSPHRAALARLHNDKSEWPQLACALLSPLLASSRAMLEAAGVNTSGPVGQARALAWLAIKADVARVWFADESPDLAPTMAALDKRLTQLERAAAALSPLAA